MKPGLRSPRERNDSPFPSVTQLSRNARPAPQFVDASRSVIARHPTDCWREVLGAGVLRDQSGFYLVTRREDVVAALRDHVSLFNSLTLLAGRRSRSADRMRDNGINLYEK